MKILILLAYYNRPKMIRFALESIKSQSYKNWELAFVDDGSDVSGENIVREILCDDLHKIKFYNTKNTEQEKINQGGSIFGKYWNDAMYNSDADIAIMLCDDDGLFKDSLNNLVNFYLENPEIIYSYGHISIYDPSKYLNPEEVEDDINFWTNHTTEINPANHVDASQVSWRIKNAKDNAIEFEYPKTANLDSGIYEKMFANFGGCQYNGIIVQYKGIYGDQLSNRQFDSPYSAKDI